MPLSLGRRLINTICTTHPLACIKMKMAQENWKTFFMKIQEAENNCSKFGRYDAFDHLLGFMWNAHTSSLDEGMNIPYVKSSLNNFDQSKVPSKSVSTHCDLDRKSSVCAVQFCVHGNFAW